MKIFVVISYADGGQKIFSSRAAAENWIIDAIGWYGEDAPFDFYIFEGELED